MLLLCSNGGWPGSWREAAPWCGVGLDCALGRWGFPWHSSLSPQCSALHLAMHLAISTETFGLYQACAALPVSSGPWVVGAAEWSSSLSPLLFLYKFPLGMVAYWCVGCSVLKETLRVGRLWTSLLQERLSKVVKSPWKLFTPIWEPARLSKGSKPYVIMLCLFGEFLPCNLWTRWPVSAESGEWRGLECL